MWKSRRKKKSPKRVLALPDLEQAKSAVLNSLTSKSGQRTHDHAIDEFVEWYCSEPRLACRKTCEIDTARMPGPRHCPERVFAAKDLEILL